MLVSLTVGKVDAGVTVLLTPDKRLIEFPSILLPPDIESGSIVDITVSRNATSEAKAERAFRALQDQIFSAFGAAEPASPVLRCRNATQTSVVLEWDPIQLATADLISLALYRNGQKAGNIPRPLQMHSTKISGLAVDTEYIFHLVLRTTAGTFSSERVTVRTHKMTDLSGITITTGILPAAVRESLNLAVERVGARIVEGVRIDTTHFVTTEGRGVAWEKAVEMNIPVVRPEWVEACEKSGRILGVTKFYLDAMRPGPVPGSTPGAESSPAAPQPQQQPQEEPKKDLPPTPPGQTSSTAGAGAAGTSRSSSSGDGDAASAAAAATSSEWAKKKDETNVDGEDSARSSSSEEAGSSSRKDEDSNPKSAVKEEQKARVEDKDIPLRPAPLSTSKAAEEYDDDDEEEDGRKKSLDEKEVTPGDGGSFQDVAL